MNPSKLLFASILALAISLTVLVSVSMVEQIHAAKTESRGGATADVQLSRTSCGKGRRIGEADDK